MGADIRGYMLYGRSPSAMVIATMLSPTAIVSGDLAGVIWAFVAGTGTGTGVVLLVYFLSNSFPVAKCIVEFIEFTDESFNSAIRRATSSSVKRSAPSRAVE